jgi:phenol 2-monooxygenase
VEFHHRGYESTDPRVRPADANGGRPSRIPDELDVLIVGTGPAGMILAAQLSRFPSISTRIIEQRAGRLEIGRADGIQARSVETFQAFGFAHRIIDEAYRITETAFWKPDGTDAAHIVRAARTQDDPTDLSEFPHLVVNQARVLDYFAEAAGNAPARITPDYGVEFMGFTIGDGESPITATLRHASGPREGEEFIVRTKYLVGADGARSRVRSSMNRRFLGDAAMHAWGVMDVLAETDFPDVRLKSAIQSRDGGNILLIPREGGYLFRLYVDLGETEAEDRGSVRQTPLSEIIERANSILRPYSIDVKSVAWWSVYEVAHRLADRFDDAAVDSGGNPAPRVFIAGDACHTHSAKAGQGMNVSMQDGFNLGWKLAAVLEGRAPASLLSTYDAERRVVAERLIAFDKEWSRLMGTPADQLQDPSELERFYVSGLEFSHGFATDYPESMIVADSRHQSLAPQYPIGKRFRSSKVVRRSDANVVHLGHLAEADGRWRIYVFSDESAPGDPNSRVEVLAEWLSHSPDSPVVRYTRPDDDDDCLFDVKVVYQQLHTEFEIADVPTVFKPRKVPFGLTDLNKAYCAGHVDKQNVDVFEERQLSRRGCVLVVRPDMYVAAVLPLEGTDELAGFFAQHMVPPPARNAR